VAPHAALRDERWPPGAQQGADEAILLVSELVTNAISHAQPREPSGQELVLSLNSAGSALCIEVRDADPCPPQPRLPDSLDESGFGIVSSASPWHTSNTTTSCDRVAGPTQIGQFCKWLLMAEGPSSLPFFWPWPTEWRSGRMYWVTHLALFGWRVVSAHRQG